MTNDLSLLSERERAVLRLVATGATNQQIAEQLDISPNTVKVHLRNIFGKIGVTSRTEASLFAVRAGLIELNQTSEVESTPDTIDSLPSSSQTESPAERLDSSEQAMLVENQSSEAGSSGLLETVELHQTSSDAPPTQEAAVSAPAYPHLSRRWVGVLGMLIGIILAVVALNLWQGITRQIDPEPTVTSQVAVADAGGTWTQRLAPGKPFTAAAAVNFGPIFVIGGWDGQNVLDTTLRYDPLSDSWRQLPPKPTAVRDIQAVILGGKIFVPGGLLGDGRASDVLEIFDPQSETWSTGQALPEPRSAYSLAVFEGRMYLFGGWDGQEYRSEVFRFDPNANSWEVLTSMPTQRAFSCAAVSPEGEVFVIGGQNSTGRLYTNESYHPALEGSSSDFPWNQRKPLDEPRSQSACGALDNEIYVFGGDQAQAPLRYDVRSDKWQILNTSPQPIGAQPALAYRDGVFYITGGELHNKPTDYMYGFSVRYSITIPIR
jgi:Response regulator containing a CheY-like receiver domain and an HTH DNA-binding domain